MAAPASWQSIIDALPDPVLALDSELIVVHANQAAHDLFPAMRLGGPVALASRSPELAEALARMVGSGERRTVGLHERFPVVRRLDVALASLAGRLPGEPAVLLVVHDVSERERLAQMRADFIAHASHELRTPLSALRGFIETLQGQARNDEAARERFLGIMAAESQRMTRILDDLLSLSRLEMRAHIAPSGRVDLAETLSAVIEALAPVAEAAGVTVSLARPEQPRFIRGDRDELVQLFSNLVQNAIKYGHRGGRVDVAASEERVAGRDVVRVTVADDGPGIAEVHLPRLTERFYRVDDRSSRAKGGTGLGLAIVKHILNRHGGELRIRSKVGEGSTFTVELPRADGK
jgi:two-component system phosphate regulon sensor histidine kinase PhoR